MFELLENWVSHLHWRLKTLQLWKKNHPGVYVCLEIWDSALCRIPSISIIHINTVKWLSSPLEVSTLPHTVLTQGLKILSNELWIHCYTTVFPLFLDFPVFLISQDLSNALVSCFSLTELQQNQFLVSQTQPSSYSQCQGSIKVSLAKGFWWRVLAQIKAQISSPCFLRANSFQSRTNASFIFELQQPCDREEPVEQRPVLALVEIIQTAQLIMSLKIQ